MTSHLLVLSELVDEICDLNDLVVGGDHIEDLTGVGLIEHRRVIAVGRCQPLDRNGATRTDGACGTGGRGDGHRPDSRRIADRRRRRHQVQRCPGTLLHKCADFGKYS